MDYRIQRLKEDLTNAQQRNKKQRIQLANYKKVHERDLETIKKYKEVIDKLSSQIRLYGKYNGEKCTRGFSMMAADFNELLDILKEVNK